MNATECTFFGGPLDGGREPMPVHIERYEVQMVDGKRLEGLPAGVYTGPVRTHHYVRQQPQLFVYAGESTD